MDYVDQLSKLNMATCTTSHNIWWLMVAESPQEWLSWGDRRDFSQQCDQRLQETGEMYVGTGGEGTRNWTEKSACPLMPDLTFRLHLVKGTSIQNARPQTHIWLPFGSVNLKRGKLLEAEGCGSHNKRHWSSGDSWPTHVLHGKVESFAVSFQKGARRNTSSTMLTLQRKTNHIQVLWYQTETSWARLPTCGRSWMLINAKEDSNVATNNWSPECCQHAIESLQTWKWKCSKCCLIAPETLIWVGTSFLPAFLPVRTSPQVCSLLTAI